MALDLIQKAGTERLSLDVMLEAISISVQDGVRSSRLLPYWQRLPDTSKGMLKALVNAQRIQVSAADDDADELVTAGLASRVESGGHIYLRLRSWYVELLARCHCRELGIPGVDVTVPLADLMPTATWLNVQAYALIHETENLIRNFLVLQLSGPGREDGGYLKGRGRKFDIDAGVSNDAFDRATTWRQKKARTEVGAGSKPLLAFLSTRDLAGILSELASQTGVTTWNGIARALLDLSDVRDAVMHNQLISDADYEELQSLRTSIYAALNSVARSPGATLIKRDNAA